MNPLITLPEAAKEFNISRSTLIRWTNNGRLPFEKIKNRKIVKRDNLSKFIEENKERIENYQNRYRKKPSLESLRNKEWLTITEAQRAFGIDSSSVRNHVAKGRIKAKIMGRIKFFNRRQIEAITENTKKIKSMPQDMMPFYKVCKILKISYTTLAKWVKEYSLPVTEIGNRKFIRKSVVNEVMKSQKGEFFKRQTAARKKEDTCIIDGKIFSMPGPCVTHGDGKETFDKIRVRLANDLHTTVLFDDTVELIDPNFFEAAIGRLYKFLPTEKIRSYLKVDGLTNDNLAVLRTVVFLAKRTYCKAA